MKKLSKLAAAGIILKDGAKLKVPLEQYLSEDNYKTIIRAYYNIAENECLINFPSFSEYQSAIRNTKKLPKFRAAENSMLRVTEDIIYRVV